jgi:uncharacterized protein YecT (DUF1311 family)
MKKISGRIKLIIITCLLGCAEAMANEVINELSRRSHISVPELNEILTDCERYQLNMNICAFRDFVQKDIELKKVADLKIKSLPTGCKNRFKNSQAQWEQQRAAQCNKEADEEAEGGSMRPMIYSECSTAAAAARIQELQLIMKCTDVK